MSSWKNKGVMVGVREKAVASKRMIRQFRLANFADNLLSRGFASLALALAIVALVIVFVAALAYFVLCADAGMTVPEAFWSAFAYTINPELPAYADVAGERSRLFITLVVVIVGLLVTSALIGIITTALTTFYEGLQRGFSPVLEQGHIAIIGFNENVQAILHELLIGSDGGQGERFVVLDDELSREEMEHRLSSFLGTSLSRFERQTGCRIVCRNANLRDVDDLRRCAVERARSIIINDYDDSLILKTLLAVTSLMREEFRADAAFEPPITVCTFRESQFARAAEHASSEARLRVLSLSETLSSLIAKTCYQPGLSSVLSEIYSYEGSELYVRPAGDCAGMMFDELFDRFAEAIPVGICRPVGSAAEGDFEVILNIPDDPSADYDAIMRLRETDDLVMLSHDGRDMDLLPERMPESAPERTPESSAGGTPERMAERMPEGTAEGTPEGTPERMPENVPESAPERTAERAPESSRQPGPSSPNGATFTSLSAVPGFVFDQTDGGRSETNQILVVGYDETFDQTIINLARYYSAVRAQGVSENCSIKLLYRIKREPRVMAARQRFLAQGIDGIVARELPSAHGTSSEGVPNSDIEILSTRVEFQCAMSNVIDLPVLESVFLAGEQFRHVIVLSDLRMNQEDADTETLLTLLYLKAIAENAKRGRYEQSSLAPFRITSEIQNMDNVDLAYNEYVSDYIISWKFIAALQVQIAESRHRYRILRDLLMPGGADIQLEAAACYVPRSSLDGQTPIDFGALSRHLRSADDPACRRVLLGYVRGSTGEHCLCPQPDSKGRKLVKLGADDMLVVVKSA